MPRFREQAGFSPGKSSIVGSSNLRFDPPLANPHQLDLRRRRDQSSSSIRIWRFGSRVGGILTITGNAWGEIRVRGGGGVSRCVRHPSDPVWLVVG